MCIVRQNDLSTDDLAFLTSRCADYAPDEDALQRSLAIHESTGVDFAPACLSQITGFYPYRSPGHSRKE